MWTYCKGSLRFFGFSKNLHPKERIILQKQCFNASFNILESINYKLNGINVHLSQAPRVDSFK